MINRNTCDQKVHKHVRQSHSDHSCANKTLSTSLNIFIFSFFLLRHDIKDHKMETSLDSYLH